MNTFDDFKPGDRVVITNLDWGGDKVAAILSGKSGTVVGPPERISESAARSANYIDVAVEGLTSEELAKVKVDGNVVLFLPDELEKV